MIKVSLVDDHFVVRSGLRHILTDEKDISITSESSNSDEIIKKLSLNSDDVDIVVLDFAMPGMNGLDTLVKIKEIREDLKVLMLSMYDDTEFALRALKAGAAGYLSKDYASKELAQAVRKINKGDIYLGKSIKLNFKAQSDTDSPQKGFSELERSIMCMIALGKSMAQISKNLSVNTELAQQSRKKIFDEICVHSNIELVHYALTKKLIQPA